MAKRFIMLMRFLHSVFGPLPNLLVLHCVDDAFLSTLCRFKQVKKQNCFWMKKTFAGEETPASRNKTTFG